jgi:HK97 family phage major capsid protein
MSMKLLELKKERAQSLKVLTDLHAQGGSGISALDSAVTESYAADIRRLDAAIAPLEADNTLSRLFRGNPGAVFGAGDPAHTTRGSSQKPMTTEYTEAFLSFVRSGGKQATSALSEGFDPLFGGFALPALPGMNSALYEANSGAGGFSVNVPTDNQIVPLATPDLGVRSVARVMPTTNDIKIPQQAAFGTAGTKAESGASTNTFSESDPTLTQFTLTAFMVGLSHTISWELLQDVAIFQEFGVRDLLTAVDILEDSLFVSGNGTSQQQGLIGNTGTGTGSAYAVDSAGDYLLNSTIDVIGTLASMQFIRKDLGNNDRGSSKLARLLALREFYSL